jgi:2-polyprenyl-3-methyl-5-hydroxy-6-metoxy-1,4-benzoquinol methylase
MHERTAQRLLSLNRTFYADFAAEFAASRSDADPALARILPYVPQRARLLDVGCGDGRLAELLERERGGASYTGVDSALALIERARTRAAGFSAISARFLVADIAYPGWSIGLQGIPFDTVVSLAVVHHLPGYARRVRVLEDMASLVARDGHIVVSTWQFLKSERLRRKIVAWSEVGISAGDLEPGDYLIDWKRGGRGIRFCHLVDSAEASSLAADAGLTVRDVFHAGGREGNLSMYVVMSPAQPASAPFAHEGHPL